MENNNNKNTYITIGVVALVIVVLAVLWMRNGAEPAEENNEATGETQGGTTGEKRFSGTISAVDTACFADGVCSVTVDGKKVILVQGGLALDSGAAVGKLLGVDSIGDLEGKMGAFANVYAKETPDGGYTLYGNSEYYVEVAKVSDK